MDAKRPRRCTAKAKTTGKRCKRLPTPGAKVCRMHGGAAPQTKRKAEERVAIAEAQRMVARAGVDADPLEHLLDSLHTAYQLQLVWGSMVAAIDEAAETDAAERDELRGSLGYYETDPDDRDDLAVTSNDRMLALNKFGEAQVHPYVVEYQKAIERRARFAKLCLDARIDERLVALHSRQVELAHKAFEGMLKDLGLSEPKRQEARRSYARHLRAA